MSDKPNMSDDPKRDPLSDMAKEDVEQPGDTPSDSPPVTGESEEGIDKQPNQNG